MSAKTNLRTGIIASPDGTKADLASVLVPRERFKRGNLYIWGYLSAATGSGYGAAGETSNQRIAYPGVQIQYTNPTDSNIVQSADWVQVFGGGTTNIFFGLKSDATLWAWGYNVNGNAGLNLADNTSISLATQITNTNGWKWASNCNTSSAGVDAAGQLYGWGYNDSYMFGTTWANGTAVGTPTLISTVQSWKEVHVAAGSLYALQMDGSLWVCGTNGQGNLGLGDVVTRSVITQVGTEKTWKRIAVCGYAFSNATVIGLKENGSLWSWGDNSFGQLGLGDVVSRSSPTQVGSDTNWRTVQRNGQSYGFFFGAIKTDGTLWTWGDNSNGQLGLGDIVARSSPTQVGPDTNWQDIYPGYYAAIATKQNGSMYAWGRNAYYNLGQSDTNARSSPVQLGAGTSGWVSAAAGLSQMHAIKDTDTELYPASSNYLIWNKAGTYSWTVPAGVYEIGIQAAAGGGSGGTGWCCDTSCSGGGGGGGGGGAFIYGTGYVYPGAVYEIVVGAGGAAQTSSASSGNAGGQTIVSYPGDTNDGTYTYVKLNGGAGGSGSTNGAAGGAGGAGGTYVLSYGINGSQSSGGAGGQGNPSGGCESGRQGGGTVFGAGGWPGPTSSYAGGGGGGGGSIGTGGHGGRRNTPGNPMSTTPGTYGGGGGGSGDEWSGERMSPGADGYVRISW